jgi:hypothetical protein
MSLKEKINKLKEKENLARSAGGSEQIEKQHRRGKLTARERIDLLLDPGSFLEQEMFVTHQSTKFGLDREKFFGDGVVTGSGKIDGRLVYLFARILRFWRPSWRRAAKICHAGPRYQGRPIIGLIDSKADSVWGHGSIFYVTPGAGVVPRFLLVLPGGLPTPGPSRFCPMVEGSENQGLDRTGGECAEDPGALKHGEKAGAVVLPAKRVLPRQKASRFPAIQFSGVFSLPRFRRESECGLCRSGEDHF